MTQTLIFCIKVRRATLHFTSLTPSCIWNTLLPALALNVGLGCKSGGTELSNMIVISQGIGLKLLNVASKS